MIERDGKFYLAPVRFSNKHKHKAKGSPSRLSHEMTGRLANASVSLSRKGSGFCVLTSLVANGGLSTDQVNYAKKLRKLAA